MFIDIKISFFASLQNDFNEFEIITSEEPLSIIHVLELLKTKSGKSAQDYFVNNEKMDPGFNLLLNGRNIQAFDGINTKIEESCEISIFPLIGGGSELILSERTLC